MQALKFLGLSAFVGGGPAGPVSSELARQSDIVGGSMSFGPAHG